MAKVKHLHIYKKKHLGRKGDYVVYACIKSDCSHYIQPDLLEGKRAECPRCGEPYTLTKSILGLAFPHCDNCVIKKSTGLEEVTSAH